MLKNKMISAVLALVLSFGLLNTGGALASSASTSSEKATSSAQQSSGQKWKVTRLSSASGQPEQKSAATVSSGNTQSFDSSNIVLNVPVLADTHIEVPTETFQSSKLATALAQEIAYAGGAQNLDALVVDGDLTNYGMTSQVQAAKSVFDKSGIDPAKTRFIFGMGNHDFYNMSQYNGTIKGAQLYTNIFGNEVFNGASESEIENADYHTVVKGYHFIVVNCAAYDGGVTYSSTDLDWLKAQLAAASAADPNKPIFVFSHPGIVGTNLGSNDGSFWAGSQLDAILKNYPQVVFFNGHLHYPEQDERDIWQGGYTAVQIGSTYYMSNHTNDDYNNNKEFIDIASGMETADCQDTSEGLFMQVDANNNVRLTRMDFETNKQIKTPWIIPAPTSQTHLTSFTPDAEKAAGTAPTFPSDGTFKVLEQDNNGYKFQFTQAQGTDSDWTYAYHLSFIDKATGKTITTLSTLSDFYRADQASDMNSTLTKTATLSQISPFKVSNNDYIVKLTALDSYGNESAPETFEVQGQGYQGSNFPDILNVNYTTGSESDLSGNLTPMVSVGSPKLVADSSLGGKTVLSLDGSSYLNYDVSDAQLADMSSSFTTESIFKLNKVGDNVVVENCQSGSGMGFETTSTNYCEIWAHINGSYTRVGTQLQTGKYYDMVATYDGSTVSLYLDGQLIGSQAAGGTVNNNSGIAICIGGNPNGHNTAISSTLLNGSVAMVRVTSAAISAGDVQSRYQSNLSGILSNTQVQVPRADVMDVNFANGSPADQTGTFVSQTLGTPIFSKDTALNRTVASFDGQTAAYRYPSNDTIYSKMQNAVSMECMVNFPDLSSNDEHDIFSNQQSGGMGFGAQGNKLVWFININGSYQELTATIYPKTWYHAVGTYDGTTAKLYVNGQLVDSASAPGTVHFPSDASGAQSYYLGCDSGPGNQMQYPSTGSVALARLYSTALSQDQVIYTYANALAAQKTTGNSTYVAKQVKTAPVIDGKLDDASWSDSFITYTDPTTGKSMQFKYTWDQNNLYVAGKYTDSTLFCNPEKIFAGDPSAPSDTLYSWDYDDVGLYISPTDSQGDYSGNDVQFIFTYQSDGKPALRVGGGASNQQANYTDGVYNAVRTGCSDTSTGWNLEAAIPFSVLGITDPTTATFAIGMAQNDVDPNAKSSVVVSDSKAAWNSFAGANTLTFSTDYDSGSSGSSSSGGGSSSSGSSGSSSSGSGSSGSGSSGSGSSGNSSSGSGSSGSGSSGNSSSGSGSSGSGSSGSGSSGSTVTMTDSSTGIQIVSQNGILPAGAVLHIEPVTSGTSYHTAQTALANIGTDFKLYQIDILSNGTAFEPNGTIIIHMPIPDGYDAGRLGIYRVNDDGTIVKMDGSVVGNQFVFSTDHLSTYALVETKTQVPSSSLSNSSLSAVSSSDNVNLAASNPDTGANSLPFMLLPVATLTGAAALLIIKRKFH